MTMNTNAVVHIKKGGARALKAGGAWIYDNEIERIEGSFENGDLATVCDFDGYCLGYGFINTRSKITVRMMSRKKDAVIDDAFLEMRIRNAWEYRKAVGDISSCRVIFGEADFLPGIVIDKFSDVLVVESLALGIDRMKLTIVDILKRVLAEDGIIIRGVYERSYAKVRLQEGMERIKGFIGEPFDTKVEIVENGVRYLVDVKDGQKTGFFLDQKYNRLAIQKLCPGKRVLDCFTHTGSFALNAGIAGAKEVLGVDASELGVSQARENAALNGLSDRVSFVCANVFELLPELEQPAGALYVTKTACDAFYHTSLAQVLDEHDIQQFVICGCATDYCLDTTIKNGASRGYGIVIAEDAHTTADRPAAQAATLIAHYNEVWRTLTIPGNPLQVKPTETILHAWQQN